MAALKVSVLLLGTLLLVAEIGHSVVVEQADEDRAIGLVRELISNSTSQQQPAPRRIVNVSTVHAMKF